ncbi:MAG: TRAP transporter small permease subunit [Pseudomonadota bacterium]
MILDHIRRGLSLFLRAGLGVLVILLIGLEVVQVFLRYFLASGITWGRDVSTLLMFAIAWLGAPYLWLHQRHLAVDLLPQNVTGSRQWSGALDLAVVVASLCLLVITRQAMQAFASIDLPALGTSAAVKFWPMAIGACLLAIAGLLNLMRPQLPT